MSDWLKEAFAHPLASLKVFVTSWPTFAASITAVLAVVAQDVVPHLPGDWPVKVLAYCAAVAGAVAAIGAAIARLTPVLFQGERGILPLPDAPALEFDPNRLVIQMPGSPVDIAELERQWKAKYAPGAAATGDDVGDTI